MTNPLHLTPYQKYKVTRPFTDYDKFVHEPGETWTFIETNFLPYEDGLTVHIIEEGNTSTTLFRLQWRPEEQAELIEHFNDYVKPCDKLNLIEPH